MASFDPAFAKTMGDEGGYANHPDDRGGETYRGWARRFHPRWEGWTYIEEAKASVGNSPKKIDAYLRERHWEMLDGLLRAAYKSEYWDPFWGDTIESQAIAEELFDVSVNSGPPRAIQFLQASLNVLNRNGKSWKDIDEDGAWGSATEAALGRAMSKGEEAMVHKAMNVFQGAFYLRLMRSKPSQESFARGWLNRVRL